MTPSSKKQQILLDVFGYRSFRAGQEEVIDSLLEGRHTLAVMPTGAGKSLCYQVPALLRGGLTIVVSPLIALMQDQVNALRLNGVAADAINSAKPRPENVAAWRRVQSGETRLLYMAPERLMTERMLQALRQRPLSMVAIDEAHCISQWGHSFRSEYLALGGLRATFPRVPIAALTATADRLTQQEIVDKIFGGDGRVFVSGFDRPNIYLAVEPKQSARGQLERFLERHRDASGIVYCLSRRKVEETAAFLAARGYRALAYHAGMDNAAREACQDAFLSEAGIVMVATIAFGMGIDKPDVRFVVHMDIPGSIEAYYQEIGRAGRDGEAAEALMLYGLDDIRMRRMFIDQSDAGDDKKRIEHRRLESLLAYCEAPLCRRQALLGYFSETIEPCGNCDLCRFPAAMIDGSHLARKVLATIAATAEMFGAGHVIDLLTGKTSEKTARLGHEALPVFGAGADLGRPEWRSIIRQMVAAGCLEIDMERFGSLRISHKGKALLEEREGFSVRLEALRQKGPKDRRRSKTALEPLPKDDWGLLGHLKAVRMALAKERGVPAYVIFPDRTLQDMAKRRPATLDEFAEVHGVGQAKLRDFGQTFLEAIRTLPAGDA